MTQEELRGKIETLFYDDDGKSPAKSTMRYFMQLINQHVAEVIGEVPHTPHAFSSDSEVAGYINAVKDIRKRAGL